MYCTAKHIVQATDPSPRSRKRSLDSSCSPRSELLAPCLPLQRAPQVSDAVDRPPIDAQAHLVALARLDEPVDALARGPPLADEVVGEEPDDLERLQAVVVALEALLGANRADRRREVLERDVRREVDAQERQGRGVDRRRREERVGQLGLDDAGGAELEAAQTRAVRRELCRRDVEVVDGEGVEPRPRLTRSASSAGDVTCDRRSSRRPLSSGSSGLAGG